MAPVGSAGPYTHPHITQIKCAFLIELAFIDTVDNYGYLV